MNASVPEKYRRIATFAAKLLAVYGLWYVVYDLWLMPDGRFDAWLSETVASSAGWLVSLLGYETYVDGRLIYATQNVRTTARAALEIADGCNGLTTIGLFIGFVVAYPGTWLRRAAFIPLGMGVIFASNVTRIIGLLLLSMHYKPGFDVVHNLGAPMFFYLIVFGLWVVWANYGGGEPGSGSGTEKPKKDVSPEAAVA